MQMETFHLFSAHHSRLWDPSFLLATAVCDLVIGCGLSDLKASVRLLFIFSLITHLNSIEEKTQKDYVCKRTLQNLDAFHKIFVFYFCRPPFCSRKGFEVAY